MSVDLTITQKGIFKKTLPLSVILGDKLRYGVPGEGNCLEPGKTGDGCLILYLPDAIGRGFSITWTLNEMNKVDLRLLTPTCTAEIREFYNTVARITKYWNGELCVEGYIEKPDEWLAGMGEFILFNKQALNTYARKVADGEEKYYVLNCALWPLVMGREEAQKFVDHPAAFDAWLHEKQSIDAYYAAPRFSIVDGEVIGRLMLAEDYTTILPLNPIVPVGMKDPRTGKELKCSKYFVVLCSFTEKLLGNVYIEEIAELLPAGKYCRFDENCILIQKLSNDEITAMLRKISGNE